MVVLCQIIRFKKLWLVDGGGFQSLAEKRQCSSSAQTRLKVVCFFGGEHYSRKTIKQKASYQTACTFNKLYNCTALQHVCKEMKNTNMTNINFTACTTHFNAVHMIRIKISVGPTKTPFRSLWMPQKMDTFVKWTSKR